MAVGMMVLIAMSASPSPRISYLFDRRLQLLQQFYATIRRRLPLHKLLEDLTWIVNPEISDVPPLRLALHQNMLRTDDVVQILEYHVVRNRAMLSYRDQDGSLPLHVACRRGASFTILQFLANRYLMFFLVSRVQQWSIHFALPRVGPTTLRGDELSRCIMQITLSSRAIHALL
jgi:hypothetical protein